MKQEKLILSEVLERIAALLDSQNKLKSQITGALFIRNTFNFCSVSLGLPFYSTNFEKLDYLDNQFIYLMFIMNIIFLLFHILMKKRETDTLNTNIWRQVNFQLIKKYGPWKMYSCIKSNKNTIWFEPWLVSQGKI